MDKKLSISSKKYRGETSAVTIRVSDALLKKIDAICEKTGRTRSDIMQKCIEFGVENIEITQ